MAQKQFTTRPNTEQQTISIDSESFRLANSVPGDVLLDFLSQADAEKPASMAETLRGLLSYAIHEDDKERFYAYIREPKNNVSLDVLAEIAGYAADVLSGGAGSDPTR